MSQIIKKADDLMRVGESKTARGLLMGLLRGHPEQVSFYQEAVNIFLYGEMYSEAEQVFGLYKSQTGKELHCDFSLDEIRRLARDESANAEEGSAASKIFKRMSPRELWGQNRNGWLPFSINEIRIYPDKIVLRKRNVEHSYQWSEIEKVSVTKKPVQTRYVNYLQKLLCLRVGSRVFKGDLSVFHNSERLIQELKGHCKVEETIITWRRLPRWFWFMLLLAPFIVLKLCTREWRFPVLLVWCAIVSLAGVIERRFLIEVKKVA